MNKLQNGHRLSRRAWIRAVGSGSLGASLAFTGAGWLQPLFAASELQESTLSHFLDWAYSRRAQAMTSRNPRLLEPIYDTANTQLLAFERERATLTPDALWDGSILEYDTSLSIINLQLEGALAMAQVYEALKVQWIQNPVAISPSLLRERQREPERYASLVPRGPRGEIVTIIGVRHEVTLERQSTGWRIVKDAFEEPPLLAGPSPDLLPGSWAAARYGIPSNGILHTDGEVSGDISPDFHTMATYTYNYVNAMNYAKSYCTSYNTNYCNYNGCGGDCANFVSQCLRAGNQVSDTTWRTFQGGCGTCGTSSPNAGANTWANNRLLREWIINSGRGYNTGDLGLLGIGDIINYDWSCCDGVYDHVTIVVQPMNPNGALICSHTPDLCNAPWSMGGAFSYAYTHLYSTYTA